MKTCKKLADQINKISKKRPENIVTNEFNDYDHIFPFWL